jgi:hypothetical protein
MTTGKGPSQAPAEAQAFIDVLPAMAWCALPDGAELSQLSTSEPVKCFGISRG